MTAIRSFVVSALGHGATGSEAFMPKVNTAPWPGSFTMKRGHNMRPLRAKGLVQDMKPSIDESGNATITWDFAMTPRRDRKHTRRMTRKMERRTAMGL